LEITIVMNLKGVSTSVIMDFITTTSSIAKETGELASVLAHAEGSGRYVKNHFKTEIRELIDISNDYTEKHNMLHREFNNRMHKTLGTKKNVLQVGHYVDKLVKGNREAFLTDEQYAEYKQREKIANAAAKTTAKKDNPKKVAKVMKLKKSE